MILGASLRREPAGMVHVRAMAMTALGVAAVLHATLLGGQAGLSGEVVNALLHIVFPVLALLEWAGVRSRGRTRWFTPLIGLAFPVVFLAGTLLRGSIVGWYPYDFVDPYPAPWACLTAGEPMSCQYFCSRLACFFACLMLWSCAAIAAASSQAQPSAGSDRQTTRRPGAGRRGSQGWRARRRAQGARGNAHSRGLHRRHEHGGARRRRLRVRHPGGRECRSSWSASTGSRSSAVSASANSSRSSRSVPVSRTATTSSSVCRISAS